MTSILKIIFDETDDNHEGQGIIGLTIKTGNIVMQMKNPNELLPEFAVLMERLANLIED